VSALSWIRGERQLLDTTGKVQLSHVLYTYIQSFNFFVLTLALGYLLVD